MSHVEKNAHRRYNPLLERWVIVCQNRLNRPWNGSVASVATPVEKKAAASNYLGPGAQRANGEKMPNYESTYVFDNDFPVFTKNENGEGDNPEIVDEDGDGLFMRQKAYGVSKVVCFHPDPDERLATMKISEIETVFKALIREMSELKVKYDWVQIFENRGAMVGCSNPHPHCQIWASNFIPSTPAKKVETQKKYFEKHKKQLLLDYLEKEKVKKERIVFSNEHWTVLVPYWAYWPFEVMVIPHRHIIYFDDLKPEEVTSLSELTKTLSIKFDNIFKCDFPYVLGWYSAPSGKHMNENHEYWQFHAHYMPPLVRSATVRKYLAGYETMAEEQRDFTPEQAAQTLRDQSSVHYTESNANTL
uniref:Galactose-1-phosphate uridylyltransferase n=1 Tax=Panagrolaimus sp. ES5 TaxID=591445 RepID=A0AC34GUF9_9BILA